MEKIADLNDFLRRASYRLRMLAARCGGIVGIEIPLEHRRGLTKRYITGEGIEIGALNAPLPLPPPARARYVDRVSSEVLSRYGVGQDAVPLSPVPVDIIDDAETLATISSGSLDFVIANHVIEHLPNPLAALETFLRVLKPGGILFMAVPDKRYTFDRRRAVTPLQDIVRDYQEGPQWSLEEHYRDWVQNVERVPDAEVAVHAQRQLQQMAEIHFHVWTRRSFIRLLRYCQDELGWPFLIETVKPNAIEFIVILRKTNPPV